MKEEDHRKYAIAAFQGYENNRIKLIKSVAISDLPDNKDIGPNNNQNVVYILRLNPNRTIHASVSAIPNRNDEKMILYIGGHNEGIGGNRYNQLISSCRQAEAFFDVKDYADNDKRHKHSVAGCLTTALLQTGFRIKDCIIDLISDAEYNELEFIIGYQEKYHHLPPWNSNRKGAQGYIPKFNV